MQPHIAHKLYTQKKKRKLIQGYKTQSKCIPVFMFVWPFKASLWFKFIEPNWICFNNKINSVLANLNLLLLFFICDYFCDSVFFFFSLFFCVSFAVGKPSNTTQDSFTHSANYFFIWATFVKLLLHYPKMVELNCFVVFFLCVFLFNQSLLAWNNKTHMRHKRK